MEALVNRDVPLRAGGLLESSRSFPFVPFPRGAPCSHSKASNGDSVNDAR